jgi:hypothetical protein
MMEYFSISAFMLVEEEPNQINERRCFYARFCLGILLERTEAGVTNNIE